MRLALVILLLLLASVAWATDYQVPSGADLNLILKVASPGDSFTLADGSYSGGIWISEKSGNALQPITLKAANVGKAIITGSTTARTSTFSLYKSSWWRVTGIVFEGAANAGIWFGSASNNNYFSFCVSRNNAVHGLLSGTSNNVTIEDSAFYGQLGSLGQHGLYASQTPSGWKITRCTFYNNNRAGVQLASQGVIGTVSGFTIDSCKFWQNGQANAAAAINCLGASGCVISNCSITDNLAGGIVFSPSGMTGGDSVANLVTNTVIIFAPGTGRTAVQQTGGNASVVGCRIWCGKSATIIQPITTLSGGIVTQSDNTIMPPMPTSSPVTGGGGNN